eukprot:CAMPEP_0116824288 /NCGR_PEP_ID=MMETSP0418-20121206/1312_1 /TAXON_ID=1158023 /ORGANISM="Astrosyne radiata, Strain 13vi08-1A" /LENGTH=168 /DNA_ID=CAMNT_0004452639 /DNA_START=10 /DNA_END=516 /DNA_ORIENTATION=+
MQQVCSKGPYDIILDDGSHVPPHVIFSLFALWPCVKEGGIYIIEDLETSYWDSGNQVYGYKLEGTGFGASPEHSVAEKLKQLIDVLVRSKTDYEDPELPLSVLPGDEEICEISFGRNLVALRKCRLEQQTDRPKHVYFGQSFNRTQIRKWLEWARSSNPQGYSKKESG